MGALSTTKIALFLEFDALSLLSKIKILVSHQFPSSLSALLGRHTELLVLPHTLKMMFINPFEKGFLVEHDDIPFIRYLAGG